MNKIIIDLITKLASPDAETKLEGLQGVSDHFSIKPEDFSQLETALVYTTVIPLLKQIKENLDGNIKDFLFDDFDDEDQGVSN